MIPAPAREALRQALGGAIRFDAETRRLTSLGVGGPADALATPGDRQALARLLALCADHGVPCRPIGRGFNLLVHDAGVDGVLLLLSLFKVLEEREGHVFAEAGVSHTRLTRFCRERGLAGLEFGAGIPGNLGGWVAMNAGIGDREVKDVVREIEIVSSDGKGPRSVGRADLEFVYRSLRSLAPGDVVVSALLAVEPSTPQKVAARIDELLERRRATQPLDVPSCGSVFKNPPGGYAGQLIEEAGLKGAREGGVMISPQHANFMVNTGGATTGDVLALIERAQDEVRRQTGIELETEVRIIGRPS